MTYGDESARNSITFDNDFDIYSFAASVEGIQLMGEKGGMLDARKMGGQGGPVNGSKTSMMGGTYGSVKMRDEGGLLNGLKMVHDMMFTTENGARVGSPNVLLLVIAGPVAERKLTSLSVKKIVA